MRIKKRYIEALSTDSLYLFHGKKQLYIVNMFEKILKGKICQEDLYDLWMKEYRRYLSAYHCVSYFFFTNSFKSIIPLLKLSAQEKQKLTELIVDCRYRLRHLLNGSYLGQDLWLKPSDDSNRINIFRKFSDDFQNILKAERKISLKNNIDVFLFILKNLRVKGYDAVKYSYTGAIKIISDMSSEWFKAHSKVILDSIRRRRNINDSLTILDIGCGSGLVSSNICETYKNSKAIGVDINIFSNGVNYFKRKNRRLFFCQADGKFIPLRSKQIDIVVCTEVVEHIIDYELLLSEINRVLKANGIVIISTPDAPVYKCPGHFSNLIEGERLVKSLNNTNFKILDKKYLPFSRGIGHYYLCSKGDS